MAIGEDGRYYGEAEISGRGSKEIKEKLAAKLNPEAKVEPEVKPNTSVDPDSHPAAGGEKQAEAVKEQQKK